jgi:DNA repair protein RecN (Recombination protein N)
MLASRLVMGAAGRAPTSGRRPPDGPEDAGGDDPGTLIFDEVDAGIGGEAAVAVGRALAAVGADHQVLVVTHLAQVAAFASAHLVVAKDVVGKGGEERTVATAGSVAGEDRVVELARMLSGRPDSRSARQHAAELLSGAGSEPNPSPTVGRQRR